MATNAVRRENKGYQCNHGEEKVMDELVIHTSPVHKHVDLVSEATVSDRDNATVHVEFQPWRLTQSQYHWRGVGEIDLGEIL
jgi:hypothetical protein